MNVSEHMLKVLVTTLRSLLFVTRLVFEVLPVREDIVTLKSSSEIRFRLVKFDMARRVILPLLAVVSRCASFVLSYSAENVCNGVVLMQCVSTLGTPTTPYTHVRDSTINQMQDY